MENIPSNALFELLQHLSGPDLLNMCSTNRVIASFCDESNDYFWKLKVLKDYPQALNKPANISWKRFYVLIGTNFMKQIPLKYFHSAFLPTNEVSLGSIWISRTDTPDQILHRANEIFLAEYPNDKPEQLNLKGLYFDLFWENPISNAKLVNLLSNYYNRGEELIYWSTVSLRSRIRAKEWIIRNATIGMRS